MYSYCILIQVIHLSLTPVGDGLTWPLRKGCNQYSFTVSHVYVIELSLLRLTSISVMHFVMYMYMCFISDKQAQIFITVEVKCIWWVLLYKVLVTKKHTILIGLS